MLLPKLHKMMKISFNFQSWKHFFLSCESICSEPLLQEWGTEPDFSAAQHHTWHAHLQKRVPGTGPPVRHREGWCVSIPLTVSWYWGGGCFWFWGDFLFAYFICCSFPHTNLENRRFCLEPPDFDTLGRRFDNSFPPCFMKRRRWFK